MGLATLARVTPAVIGLTVVAAGTSVPELAVSLIAALRGSEAIAVGNVVGSNIFNITFILGLAALIRPLAISGNTIRLEYPVLAAGDPARAWRSATTAGSAGSTRRCSWRSTSASWPTW